MYSFVNSILHPTTGAAHDALQACEKWDKFMNRCAVDYTAKDISYHDEGYFSLTVSRTVTSRPCSGLMSDVVIVRESDRHVLFIESAIAQTNMFKWSDLLNVQNHTDGEKSYTGYSDEELLAWYESTRKAIIAEFLTGTNDIYPTVK